MLKNKILAVHQIQDAVNLLIMNKLKSFWATLSGSISSIIPLFFAVCKTGACTAVCVSPIASLLGISSATFVATPLAKSLFPLLLVISSVSFTVSYYQLYVLTKLSTNTNNCGDGSCGCEPPKQSMQYKFSLYSFWIGLIASIVFFTYYEYENYKANSVGMQTTATACCSPTEAGAAVQDTISVACCASGVACDTSAAAQSDTTATTPCCSGNQKCE